MIAAIIAAATIPTAAFAAAFTAASIASASIAAASIVAKVERDREMERLDRQYPGYGWAANKGYPTEAHRRALATLGVTPAHRRSFAPVRDLLDGQG